MQILICTDIFGASGAIRAGFRRMTDCQYYELSSSRINCAFTLHAAASLVSMLLQDPVNPLRHFFCRARKAYRFFSGNFVRPPFGATARCVLSVARYEVASEAVTVTETSGYKRHWRHFCCLCGLQL